MLATVFIMVLLFLGATIFGLVVLIRAGLRTQGAPVADHLVFVDERDHSEQELLEIYGIERQGAQFAYGRVALFDSLEAAIAYAKTVPPDSRPRRAGSRR